MLVAVGARDASNVFHAAAAAAALGVLVGVVKAVVHDDVVAELLVWKKEMGKVDGFAGAG